MLVGKSERSASSVIPTSSGTSRRGDPTRPSGISRTIKVSATARATKDPAFDAADRWVVTWLAGGYCSGHDANHRQQADDGVELVFPVGPGREALLGAAEDVAMPGNAEGFGPSEQAGKQCQPIRLPSLAPAVGGRARNADMVVILPWIGFGHHNAVAAV